ncbi:MAG TPA: ATP synthase F1 subunit delta [Bacteroidales bacterium]|nr:ATP synthase F1 subunit delta [Bacteroidales bacterium]
MNDSKISVRYAKALFQTALEDDLTEEVMKDLTLLVGSLKTPDFKEILESPVVKTSQKKNLITTVFQPSVNELTYNFLMLLLEKKRESYIEGIIRNFSRTYREKKGIRKAEITIASTIMDSTRKEFLSILEKTFAARIELEEIINPSIIGGFVLKVEDEQYDASVLTGLAKMRKQLLQTSIEK